MCKTKLFRNLLQKEMNLNKKKTRNAFNIRHWHDTKPSNKKRLGSDKFSMW